VHRGEAESELRVSVTVSAVDAPRPEDLGPAMVIRSKRSPAGAMVELAQRQSQQ